MSNRWPGGLIRQTPVTPAGPFQTGAAAGVWSLAEASYWTKQGLWPTAGNIFAVEDVFSTYLYTGTGAAQTITNNINLSGQGGLVWIKSRSTTGNHFLFDTTRGVSVEINSNTTDSNVTLANSLTAFNSNGFAISSATGIGVNGTTYASWTFREAPNFFDVVTYTGDGVAGRAIPHNLGSVPGMILVKRTSTATAWAVYHRSNGNTSYMVLNTTSAVTASANRWNNTTPTATEFTVGSSTDVNANGSTYVAYLFAHDTASTGLIQCGSYTGNGSATGPVIDLGWEPQWLMVKSVSGASNWQIIDNMRGMPVDSADATLQANLTGAETSVEYVSPTATGFQITSTNNNVNTNTFDYIYMAIRRGPMKTPTLGTSVFAPVLSSSYPSTLTAGFPVDMALSGTRTPAGVEKGINDRLRGFSNTSTGTSPWLVTQTTAAETPNATVPSYYLANNTTITVGTYFNGTTIANYLFRRAPGFFDEVCYTGTGVAGQQNNHNLGVVPELMIVKARSVGPTDWQVYCQYLGTMPKRLVLNSANGVSTSDHFYAAPTSTVFYANTYQTIGQNGVTYVNYLFASCPGVSKVGSYTGNGSSQTINCAFTTGSRFVMIKRTDSTGDWYVWDSARGIVAGNDPYIALNTDAAEVTTDDSVDTDNTGFIVNQVAASNVNVNGATYIFLAIA
jgi:hypothetical protein